MQLPPHSEGLRSFWLRVRSNWLALAILVVLGVLVVVSGNPVDLPDIPTGDDQAPDGDEAEFEQPEPTIKATSVATPEPTPTLEPRRARLIEWVAPVNGATVSGKVMFEVSAPEFVERIAISVVGEPSARVQQGDDPLSVWVDTPSLADGLYQIEAVGFDADGSVVDVSHTSIVINNSTTTPSITRDVAGFDWYLPPGIDPAEHSGIYGYGDLNDIMTIQVPMLNWATLHKGDGEYNWAPLDELLDAGPVVLRLKCGTPSHVPRFILNRNERWQRFINATGAREIPQWQSGWLEEWEPFITALGNRYRDNPKFVGLQLQITESGEPFMISENATGFERAGMTPDVLENFLSRYHSLALDAFAGSEWKVFSVVRPNFLSAYQGSYTVEQYNRAIRNATVPMFERGMGIRGSGDTEQYETSSPWDEWLTIRNGIVLTNDESFPPIAQEGHVDGQVENWYGGNKSHRVTTDDEETLRHGIRMSLLRALVDQYSYLWVDSDDLEFMGHDLGRYVQLSLGRRPQNAPDAFVVLGQFGEISAMPRWLWPTNLQDSARGVYMDTEGLGFISNENYLGRTFRSTLDFEIDDRFLDATKNHNVEVAVTFLDNGSTWHLEYQSNGTRVRSPIIAGNGSDDWRTVTMRLPQLSQTRQPSGVPDLQLVSDSSPVTVFMVRVVR